MVVTLIVAALAVLGVGLVLGSLLMRTWASARERRARAMVERLRPAAIELVDGDGAAPPVLTEPEALLFDDLLVHYARQLRGEPDRRIAAYFEATGAVDEQVRRLGSRRERRRVEAAFRLGDLTSGRAVPDLVQALGDRSADVRAAAVRSLGRLSASESAEALLALSAAGRVPEAVVGEAILEIGTPAVPHLRDLLGHEDARLRAGAVQLIGLLGSAGDAAVLLDRLRDASAEVRAAAAGAVGRLGEETGMDALIGLLDDRVPFVRTAAAQALGQIGDASAADALLHIACTDEFDPAAVAAVALARIDPARARAAAAAPDAGPHLHEVADRLAL